MQAVREAEQNKDFQKLGRPYTPSTQFMAEILHADQALRELYMLLHAGSTPDWEAIHHAVEGVLNTGIAIIQRAKEERRKYENG